MQNQKRVVIDYVYPQINGGDFFIKRVVNEIVNVHAHVLVDGNDVIAASVLFKHEKDKTWQEVRMHHTQNDEWQAAFTVEKQGFYSYKVEGWVDDALNWQHGISRKIDDNQKVTSELLEGVMYLKAVSKKASASEKKYLKHLETIFVDATHYDEAVKEAVSEQLHHIFETYPEKHLA